MTVPDPNQESGVRGPEPGGRSPESGIRFHPWIMPAGVDIGSCADTSTVPGRNGPARRFAWTRSLHHFLVLHPIIPILLIAWAAAARAGPDDIPLIEFDDPRCGAFGYDRAAPMPLLPVASPVVLDLTLHGDLAKPAEDLREVLSRDIELSGVFTRLPADQRPPPAFWTWMDEVTFDYLGWRDAGAWLVPVLELRQAESGATEVRIKAYLTEEGDSLHASAETVVVRAGRVETLAHRVVSALLQCITGLPGVFGTRIAYSYRLNPGDPKEIYVVEFGSASPARVSLDGTLAILPAWGPRGSIVYTGYRRGNPDLYRIESPGRAEVEAHLLSDRPGMNTGAAFSPRGDALAVTMVTDGNVDVFLADPVTGRVRARLTDAPGVDSSPTWSPDGRRIAFVSDRFGGPQIFLMDADGAGQHPLPLPGGYNTSPDWSPDGSAIAYQSRGEGSRFSIWRYDLATGTPARLTMGPWDDEEPSFSPDGRLIAFTSTRHGAKRLYVMTRDGHRVQSLDLGAGEFFTPAWERLFTR